MIGASSSIDDSLKWGEGVSHLIKTLFIITTALMQSKHHDLASAQILLPLVRVLNSYDSLTFSPEPQPELILTAQSSLLPKCA